MLHSASQWQDHYDILNVSSTADSNTIRKAYKALALEHHPDKVNPYQRKEATVKFQKVNISRDQDFCRANHSIDCPRIRNPI